MNIDNLTLSNVRLTIAETYSIEVSSDKKPSEKKIIHIATNAHTQRDRINNLTFIHVSHINCGNYTIPNKAKITQLIVEEMQVRFPNFTIVLPPYLEAQRMGISYDQYMERFPNISISMLDSPLLSKSPEQ
jgi:hypothetical protein